MTASIALPEYFTRPLVTDVKQWFLKDISEILAKYRASPTFAERALAAG
jgi:hypothetical protein